MKKIFLLSALTICNLSFAETVRVNIASNAYPDGMSAEQYQQRLILQNTQYTITVPDTKAAADAKAKALAAVAERDRAAKADARAKARAAEAAKAQAARDATEEKREAISKESE